MIAVHALSQENIISADFLTGFGKMPVKCVFEGIGTGVVVAEIEGVALAVKTAVRDCVAVIVPPWRFWPPPAG